MRSLPRSVIAESADCGAEVYLIPEHGLCRLLLDQTKGGGWKELRRVEDGELVTHKASLEQLAALIVKRAAPTSRPAGDSSAPHAEF